jgi:glycosyltransferase involved in cell wall biosynthesis
VTTAPLVTVLMAVHNGAAYVDAAIDSILRQTFTNFEFLIVDDASTDDTPRRIAAFRDPRIRVVRNDVNLGLTRSLNRGLGMARGPLVARQDADDVSHAGRLAAQVAFLEREPDVVVLGTQGRYIDSRGRVRRVAPWPKSTSNLAIRWQLLFDGPFIHSSVMFRTAIIWNDLGGYDESFVTSQDFELWSRVRSRGFAMRNLPATLVDFRLHAASVTTRYNLDRIAKLRPVFLRTLVDDLGPEAVPAGWPDTWIRTNYPAAFSDVVQPVAPVAHAIDLIHARFVQVHPCAAHDGEIRRHMAAMLIRLANYAAGRRAIKSILPFAWAYRLDAVMATLAVPRYVGHLVFAKWRRRAAVVVERGARR